MSPSVPPPNMPSPPGGEGAGAPGGAPGPTTPPARSLRAKMVASGVLVAVVAGVAFAVFGGASSKVVDPVAEAATVSSGAPGYQMRMSMEMTSPALGAPIIATGSGAFDLRDHTGSLTMAMNLGNNPQVAQSLGTNTFRLTEIVSGTTIYMKLPAAATSSLPLSGKQWIELDFAKLSGIPGLSSFESNPASSNPTEMLEYLRETSNGVVAEGHERVDGFETTHYRADMSLDRAAEAVPAAERGVAEQALSKLEQLTQIHEVPIDVWVDTHHLVRRIEMSITMNLGSGQSMNEDMTMDISHYGPEPAPALPPADQVANLDNLMGSLG